MQRKTWIAAAAVLLATSPFLASPAWAQAWPARPIKLVVPFPAGGPTDTASRIMGQRLAERLKQTVVVENRAGASGAIAAAQVAKSAPDGNTLMMLATPTMLAPHFNKAAGYDTTKDFMPVATVYDLPIVIVVNPVLLPDVTDLAKLIAHAIREESPKAEAPVKRRSIWQTFLMPVAACAGMVLTFWIGKNAQKPYEIDVAGAPKAIPVEQLVYTPETGVKAEWFASTEASAMVIVLDGVRAIPDTMDFSETTYVPGNREIDSTAEVDSTLQEELAR